MNNIPVEKNRRILVIDDNRAIHDDFRKILTTDTTTGAALDASEEAVFGSSTKVVRQVQFEVDSAYQGQEGVMLVKQALEAGRPYALAFVDVRMPPGWDGVETTQKIWAIDPDIQIVICTAYSDYSWNEMFEKIGNCDGLVILKKPFDTVEALQLAHAFVEKWWLHQQAARKMEELESRVAERTQDLANSLSVLNATLESTADGIVAEDLSGKVVSYNTKFAATWRFPAGMLARRDAAEIRAHIAGQVKDSAKFLQRTEELQAELQVQGYDVIELKDGRIFERYVIPQRIDRKCVGTVINWRNITERKRVEETLRQSEDQFRAMFELASVGIAQADPRTGQWLRVNKKMCEITGYSAAEMLQMHISEITHPEDRKQDREKFEQIVRGESPDYRMEKRYLRKDGALAWVNVNLTIIRDADGQPTRAMVAIEDITERKRFEARLFQSQKMETVGKLAGGVAHEFNNILTAIIGESESLLRDLPAKSPLAESATAINKAAGRAATLTRQLLAYGRKQMLKPETLDLNRVIASMAGMFYRLMGDAADTQIVPAPGLKAVLVDAGQIEQVIMNMIFNARDAMPNGGKLTLETANVSLDENSVGRNPELKPGDYVMLAITDTGLGMSEEVKARAFEPFFTTKGIGQGTGLGLSTCYGIIKQSGGHISVYSEPGRGSTFKIYLPSIEPPTEIPLQRPDSPDMPRGTETILLVEDEPAVREMAGALLKRLGYTVLAAANGIEALSLKQQRDIGHIDLLFTDVVMPHMSGKELSDRVRVLYPHTRILFTSAYTENAIVHQGVLNKGVTLLQKPFTPSALAQKVRQVLDQPGAPGPEETPKPLTSQ